MCPCVDSVSVSVGSVRGAHKGACVYVEREGAGVVCKLGVWGVAMRQLCVQHDSPVPLDAVAAQGNNLGADGAEALRPALEKLTKLERLYLRGTCGDVQWRWVVL